MIQANSDIAFDDLVPAPQTPASDPGTSGASPNADEPWPGNPILQANFAPPLGRRVAQRNPDASFGNALSGGGTAAPGDISFDDLVPNKSANQPAPQQNGPSPFGMFADLVLARQRQAVEATAQALRDYDAATLPYRLLAQTQPPSKPGDDANFLPPIGDVDSSAMRSPADLADYEQGLYQDYTGGVAKPGTAAPSTVPRPAGEAENGPLNFYDLLKEALFHSNNPIPRIDVQPAPGALNTAEQIGAGVANTASGMFNFLGTPIGGLAALAGAGPELVPGVVPQIIRAGAGLGFGVQGAREIVPDAAGMIDATGAQARTEAALKAAMDALMLGGGLHGGASLADLSREAVTPSAGADAEPPASPQAPAPPDAAQADRIAVAQAFQNSADGLAGLGRSYTLGDLQGEQAQPGFDPDDPDAARGAGFSPADVQRMIGNRVLRQNASGSFDFDPQLRSLAQNPAEIPSSAFQPEDPEQDPLQQAMAQWRWQQQLEDIRQSLAYEAGTEDRALQLAAQFIANSADRSADGQPSLAEAERDAALKANIANSAPVEAGVDPGTIDAYNRAHEILSNRVDEELPPAQGETASPLAPNMRSRPLDAGDLEMAMRQRQGNALTESEAQADTSAPASSAGEAEKRIDATLPERFGINRNPGQGGFIDPTILSDIVDAGRRILKRGMDFAGWAGRMISRFGSKVAGYLGHAWNYIRQRPSLSNIATVIPRMHALMAGDVPANSGAPDAARGLTYEPASYHGRRQSGRKSPGPKHGEQALKSSVAISENSPNRVGIDYASGEFVVFHMTREGQFDGHTRPWRGLTTAMKNALIKSGMVNRKGDILWNK